MAEVRSGQPNGSGDVLGGIELRNLIRYHAGGLALLDVVTFTGPDKERRFSLEGNLITAHYVADYGPIGEPFISVRVEGQSISRNGQKSYATGNRWTLPEIVSVSYPEAGGVQFDWANGQNGVPGSEYTMYMDHVTDPVAFNLRWFADRNMSL